VYDEYWKRGAKDNHREIDVPALSISGWWDSNGPGAPLHFEAMKASPSASKQKLLIGPWPHWLNRNRVLSGVDLGEHAVIRLNDYITRFFDCWLKGAQNGIEDERPVYVFVTGANEWWAENDWPLPGTEEVPFYLHSHGRANSLKGDGVLSTEPPKTEQP